MISPSDGYTEEELNDEKDFNERPEWLKWRYAAYDETTSRWDDDQVGWYMRLLNRSAMVQIPEEGYLEDDDKRLKQIAGFKELDKITSWYQGRGVQIPTELLDKVREDREKSWQQVRRKFTSSKKHPGYVYNRPLLKSIKEAVSKANLR